MNVKELDKADIKKWDGFVDISNNGTLFHRIEFLDYHRKEKYKFLHLEFFHRHNPIAVISGELKGHYYRSPVGASFGSFVVGNASFSQLEQLIDLFIITMKKRGVSTISLTFPPNIYSKKVDETLQYLLIYKGFDLKKSLISSIVNIDEVNGVSHFSKRFRGSLAKSYKGNLRVDINLDYKNFYTILLENKKKFNTLPTHTLSELIYLQKKFPENLKLFMVYKGRDAIAGILLFVVSPQNVLVFYICHDYQFHKSNAVSRALYETIMWSKANKYKWYDLGVSMDTQSSNAMEPSRNLIFFKESIGVTHVVRNTYTLHI